MATILIVDDEKNYLWMLDELLRGEGFDVVTCEKGTDALIVLREATIDVLLTDLRMAEMDGLTVLEKAREISPATSPLLMTAYGTIERAVEAMRRGAYDFIVKPFENAHLIRTIHRAIERSVLVRENVRLSSSLARQFHPDRLIGRSAGMLGIWNKIHRVTDSKSAVLICGESGVGKELVARAIHCNGLRSGRPFLAVNCSALTDSLAESELFGHEKGAFTGALSRHLGLFEQANGGTLFLDEIADLPMPLQAKLLRVLDSQEIRRIGSEKTFHVDVRILAATHRSLKSEVKEGRFREDLFFRLHVVQIDIPPLRERADDIPQLAEAYLQGLVREGKARGKQFSQATIELLKRYRWPGNVRELQNAIAHAALMALEDDIQPDDFPLELSATGEWEQSFNRILPDDAPLDSTLKTVERLMITRALARTGGIQARAADLLQISRSLLQYKLKTLSAPQTDPSTKK
ncbi:MAG: sigma-54-dependent Fis family transcriptional regulator [Nitrospira sp.]|nr:sigma-54-dependent Fis family transcriptional regulator [Nitrospira sp.]